MGLLRRFALIFLILAGTVGCDQISKSVARDHLQGQATQHYLADTFRLQYAENRGAFLGLGKSLSKTVRQAIFTVGAIAMVAAVLLYALLSNGISRTDIISLALIGAGGVGNIIDRVRFDGSVTDFMNLGIGPVRTGIFNVADVALMAGLALMLLVAWRGARQPQDA